MARPIVRINADNPVGSRQAIFTKLKPLWGTFANCNFATHGLCSQSFDDRLDILGPLVIDHHHFDEKVVVMRNGFMT